MTKFRNFKILVLVFASLALNSCDNDDGAKTISPSILGSSTVYDVVSKNGSLSSLNAALETASGDLPATLKGEGPFTLFAPDNAAFDNLAALTGFESATDLLEDIDPALLSTILSYHVVAGDNGAGDLTEGTVLTPSASGELTVTVLVDGDDQTIQILDATNTPQTNPVSNVTQSNSGPGNGTVHVVDKVLLPQEAIDAFDIDIRPTVADLATSSDDLSTLVSALAKAGLTDTVKDLDTANVLAPTNQAFADFLEILRDDYNSLDDFDNDVEIKALGDILKYHVLPGTMDLMVGPADTALEDSSVEVIADNGGFGFGDASDTNASTISANIEAKNGFVQIIDKVLLPQAGVDFIALFSTNDLATTVVETPSLSLLEEALAATDLVETFIDATNESFIQEEDEEDEDFEKRRTPSNYTYYKPATVFAPSDAAFQDLLTALGDDYTSIASFDTEEELALLKEIVQYHVIEGSITSDALTAGAVTTLAEKDIEVIEVLGTDDFVIGDASNNVNANLMIPNVMARNGVVHIIDKVLLPKSAVDFIKSVNAE